MRAVAERFHIATDAGRGHLDDDHGFAPADERGAGLWVLVALGLAAGAALGLALPIPL